MRGCVMQSDFSLWRGNAQYIRVCQDIRVYGDERVYQNKGLCHDNRVHGD